MSTLVTVTTADGIATLTLNDPQKKNAMSEALADAFLAAVTALKTSDARVCVVRGAGNTFSSGGDLAMLEKLRAMTPEETRTFMLGYYARFLSLLDLPMPTIAFVEGVAIGAGLGLALACDMAIATATATCSLSFVKLGLHPGLGTTFFAPLRFGKTHAAELLLSGRSFDGAYLHEIGGALPCATDPMAIARSIADNGPLAVRALKQSLQVDRTALTAALEREALAQSESYASQDLGEGLAAIKTKRKAVFLGR